MKITLAESAVRDLEEIVAFYKERGSRDVGADDVGRVVLELGNDSIRELIKSPFRIVYRREKDRVRVVRVWRSERLLRLPPDS